MYFKFEKYTIFKVLQAKNRVNQLNKIHNILLKLVGLICHRRLELMFGSVMLGRPSRR